MVQEINFQLLQDINFDFDVLYELKVKEHMAAYKIQQWWKYITISPHYAIGRKFINKTYDDLFEK